MLATCVQVFFKKDQETFKKFSNKVGTRVSVNYSSAERAAMKSDLKARFFVIQIFVISKGTPPSP